MAEKLDKPGKPKPAKAALLKRAAEEARRRAEARRQQAARKTKLGIA